MVNGQWLSASISVIMLLFCPVGIDGWVGRWGVSYYLFNCCTLLLPIASRYGNGCRTPASPSMPQCSSLLEICWLCSYEATGMKFMINAKIFAALNPTRLVSRLPSIVYNTLRGFYCRPSRWQPLASQLTYSLIDRL